MNQNQISNQELIKILLEGVNDLLPGKLINTKSDIQANLSYDSILVTYEDKIKPTTTNIESTMIELFDSRNVPDSVPTDYLLTTEFESRLIRGKTIMVKVHYKGMVISFTK